MATKRRIDRILAPDYLQDLQGRPLEEIRVMKGDAAEEEAMASYERRLLHGRLAILRAELQRRAGDASASIVEMLPQILAEGDRASRGAFPIGDPTIPDHPSRRVTKLVSDDTLANLESLGDEEIRGYIVTLEEAEREASATRRSVIGVLDTLNGEIARRYRDGEVAPGDAFAGS